RRGGEEGRRTGGEEGGFHGFTSNPLNLQNDPCILLFDASAVTKRRLNKTVILQMLPQKALTKSLHVYSKFHFVLLGGKKKKKKKKSASKKASSSSRRRRSCRRVFSFGRRPAGYGSQRAERRETRGDKMRRMCV
ncbi:Hypothetical predicted protein, partial [Scomber scombrus]